MPDHAEIKRFVRYDLGCNCPESVFDSIRCDKTGDNGLQLGHITIGDRLLVVLLDADTQADLPGAVREAVQAGVAERDRHGWNRVRLVLRGDSPAEWRGPAEAAFAATMPDERTHLHVVDTATTAGLGI